MYYLVYVSAALKLMDDVELDVILETSRKNNQENGITGILLYSEGTFMQVLEGEKEAVLSLFEKIEHDERHKGIIKLGSGDLEERLFSDWSMGFKSATSQELSKISDFADSRTLQLPQNDVHPTVVMLKSFFESTGMQLCVLATLFGSEINDILNTCLL